MSRWDDDWKRRDEEREQYRGDVFYQVWRSGGNPDAIDYDHVSDCYWDGYTTDECASAELRSQRRREPEPEYPQEDEQYPEEADHDAAREEEKL